MRTLKEYRQVQESFIFDLIQNNPLISTAITALAGGTFSALKRIQAYVTENEKGQRFVKDLVNLANLAQKLGAQHPKVQAAGNSIIQGYKDLFNEQRLKERIKILLDNL